MGALRLLYTSSKFFNYFSQCNIKKISSTPWGWIYISVHPALGRLNSLASFHLQRKYAPIISMKRPARTYFLFPLSGRKSVCAVEWWANTVPHNMELRPRQNTLSIRIEVTLQGMLISYVQPFTLSILYNEYLHDNILLLFFMCQVVMDDNFTNKFSCVCVMK